MKYLVSTTLSIVANIAAFVSPASAGLTYTADQTSDGLRYIMVSGEFDFADNLDQFAALVRSHDPSVIGFNSPGGNVVKAMELGRLIRSYKLSTLQPKGPDCASACALAFLGGVERWAEPGAIGVHKSSFNAPHAMDTRTAVSAVQQLTADVMSYMIEMGTDPALLQLSLKYESDDMRYLSRSEMEHYRVISSDAGDRQPAPAQPPAPATASPQIAAPAGSQAQSLLAIPEARSGRIRHPKGAAPLKALPDGKSGSLANLRNGETVAILDNAERWYRVRTGGVTGYMHHTWVYVDQYESGPFGQRHIQVKSFDNLADAASYVRSAPLPLSAYIATNGWFAVTLEDTYGEDMAAKLVKALKARGAIPDDAFMTYGNTYVRKVCCR